MEATSAEIFDSSSESETARLANCSQSFARLRSTCVGHRGVTTRAPGDLAHPHLDPHESCAKRCARGQPKQPLANARSAEERRLCDERALLIMHENCDAPQNSPVQAIHAAGPRCD